MLKTHLQAFIPGLLGRNEPEDPRYITWLTSVEKPLHDLCHLIDQLGGSSPRFGNKDLMKEMFELIPAITAKLLEECLGANPAATHIQETRLSLLRVWQALMFPIEEILEQRQRGAIFSLIHTIMVRPEFDPEHLCIDATAVAFHCQPEVKEAFQHYLKLLVQTHQKVTRYLECQAPLPLDTPYYNLHVIRPITKILAVSYFRIPGVDASVVDSLAIPRTVSYDLDDYQFALVDKEKRKKKEHKYVDSPVPKRVVQTAPPIPTRPKPEKPVSNDVPPTEHSQEAEPPKEVESREPIQTPEPGPISVPQPDPELLEEDQQNLFVQALSDSPRVEPTLDPVLLFQPDDYKFLQEDVEPVATKPKPDLSSVMFSASLHAPAAGNKHRFSDTNPFRPKPISPSRPSRPGTDPGSEMTEKPLLPPRPDGPPRKAETGSMLSPLSRSARPDLERSVQAQAPTSQEKGRTRTVSDSSSTAPTLPPRPKATDPPPELPPRTKAPPPIPPRSTPSEEREVPDRALEERGLFASISSLFNNNPAPQPQSQPQESNFSSLLRSVWAFGAQQQPEKPPDRPKARVDSPIPVRRSAKKELSNYCIQSTDLVPHNSGATYQPSTLRKSTWNATFSGLEVQSLIGSPTKKKQDTWLKWLAPDSLLFLLFLREWILHVQMMITQTRFEYKGTRASPLISCVPFNRRGFEWPSLTGYVVMVSAYLYTLRKHASETNRAISECNSVVYLCSPLLINYQLRALLSSIPVFDLTPILERQKKEKAARKKLLEQKANKEKAKQAKKKEKSKSKQKVSKPMESPVRTPPYDVVVPKPAIDPVIIHSIIGDTVSEPEQNESTDSSGTEEIESSDDPSQTVSEKRRNYGIKFAKQNRTNLVTLETLKTNQPEPETEASNQIIEDFCTAAGVNDVQKVKEFTAFPNCATFINEPNKGGQNALFCASSQGAVQVVSELLTVPTLNLDFNPPLPNHQGTALHAAALCGHLEIVALLLVAGASPNVKNQAGNLPTHATSAEVQSIFQLFQDQGDIGIASAFPVVQPILDSKREKVKQKDLKSSQKKKPVEKPAKVLSKSDKKKKEMAFLPPVVNPIDVLAKLFHWMGMYNETLPPRFDCEYFCECIDRIVALEHHQLTSRLVTLLYANSHLFTGHIRKVVFTDCLITKHFFSLFLHWDETARQYFLQLLVFKIIRKPRSEMAQDLNKLNNYSLDENLDRTVYTKVQCYIQIAEENLRSATLNKESKDNFYPEHWNIYVPRAISEFHTFLGLCDQWETRVQTGESSGDWKLKTLSSLNPTPLPPGVQRNPPRIGPQQTKAAASEFEQEARPQTNVENSIQTVKTDLPTQPKNFAPLFLPSSEIGGPDTQSHFHFSDYVPSVQVSTIQNEAPKDLIPTSLENINPHSSPSQTESPVIEPQTTHSISTSAEAKTLLVEEPTETDQDLDSPPLTEPKDESKSC